jgi:hypothetical protein
MIKSSFTSCMGANVGFLISFVNFSILLTIWCVLMFLIFSLRGPVVSIALIV